MQEADEQDTCRICSAPAEPDQPLFHPCKCSGTIRYIHQDCLTTWLAHSKKKNCDVCKHPYSFTKVYAPNMPSTLPPLLLVRRLVQHLFLAILFILRAMAVATIWLGVLPWVTVWTWRMYFSMGESAAWWISDRPRPPSAEPTSFYTKARYDSPTPPPNSLLGRINHHPMWAALSADIFTGQIIASLIVLIFVAIFLLREWISQNARPGVFEDEEVLPDDPIPQPQPQPEEQEPRLIPVLPPPQPPIRLPFPLPQGRRQLPPLPPIQQRAAPNNGPEAAALHQRMDALLAMDTDHVHRQNFNPVDAANPDRWALDDEGDVHNRRPRKKKAVNGATDVKMDVHRHRRNGDLEEDAKRKSFHRRIHIARTSAARRRVFTKRGASSSPSPPLVTPPGQSAPALPIVIPQSPFDFTFKAPSNGFEEVPIENGPSTASSSSTSFSRDGSLPSSGLSSFTRTTPDLSTSRPTTSIVIDNKPSTSASPFPSVALQPPSGGIPFALRKWDSPPPGNPPPPSYPARPPLPTITLPRSGSASPFLYTPGRTPRESPSLATYRPPEELEAEARPSGYFDKDEDFSSADEDEIKIPGDRVKRATAKVRGKKRQVDDVDGSGEGEDDSDTSSDVEAEHARYFADDPDPKPRMRDGTPRPKALELVSDTESEGTEEDEDEQEGAVVFREEDEDEEQAEGDMFGFEDGAWEDADDAEMNENAEAQAVPGLEPVEGANPAADAEAAANMDLNDEVDGNVEDDMEGAMEAIGMRGPIFGVFQNAALMIFVLDTAIGLCIWLPFTIGKTTALLSLDPHRLMQVLHLPIRAMRLVTDPIVDFVAYILVGLILPRILDVFSVFFGVFMLVGSNSFGRFINAPTSNGMSDFSSRLLNTSSEFFNKPLDYLSSWTHPSNSTGGAEFVSNSTSLFMSIPDHLGFTEPYFAALGHEVRELVVRFQISWIRLALGGGPSNRAFAILLGYCVVIFLFCLYLNILTVGNAKTAGIAVRNAVRQQLLVLKVATFIFIELVIFPLGCGIVLDLCTVWLFPEANMHSRVAFFGQAPLTAMFYHWVAGTMFMYTFAVLLSGCRNVMRAGAMWFIKDPQDQNSHPIRDILDRPTLVQLRKIFISGLMYSFVVACVVGSVAGLLLMGHKSIMPFRWKNREPLSNVPVDLLFLHLVLPYTMHYFRPKKAVKEVATSVWKFLATRLRLTSYFFGGRHPREEYTPSKWQDNFLRPETYVEEDNIIPDGYFRRVPATDNLALPRDMRATVTVDADGEPIDEAGRELMALQNAEAEKAKHNVKEDFMVVYIPPYFRWRVIAFITLLWLIGAVFVGVMVAVPVSLGRSFFHLFTPREVHDGYSFIIGFYLIWVCYLTARAIDRLDKRRMRARGADGPRADLHVLILKRGLLWLAKTAYMMLFLGIVIPVLLAVVIDLYIVLPIRFTVNPAMVPRIRIVDQWALGLLYTKIGLHAFRIQPPNRITRGLHHIMVLGWTRPDPIMATKELIAPLVGGLLGMILLPGAISTALQYSLPNTPLDNRFIFMHVYPSVFVVAGAFRSAVTAFSMLSAWSQAIRDKEFLVEMRLRNHDPELEEKEKENNRAEGDETFDEEDEVDVDVVADGGAVVVEPVPPLDAPVMQNPLLANEGIII